MGKPHVKIKIPLAAVVYYYRIEKHNENEWMRFMHGRQKISEKKTNGRKIYQKKEDDRSFCYSKWSGCRLWYSNENTLWVT